MSTSGGALFAQSAWPVTDGRISPAIREAAKGSRPEELATYEASLRIARLVIDRL
jgi:hypothetical protein